jgi:dihydrofolate synthase/folylpolyglutamate synthase
VAEIARTKAGIIKPAASVVSAAQPAEALAEIRRAAELTESTLAVEGEQFSVVDRRPAVGGQLVSLRGLAGEYRDLVLPLYGAHQAQNAAVAVAAVEAFLGGGTTPLGDEALREGLATASSPGRLQRIGAQPPVIVDAAHNPHGARALVAALRESFDFDELVIVFGALGDKDAAGIAAVLAETGAAFVVTQAESERAIPAERLAGEVAAIVGAERVQLAPRLEDALELARDWAAEGEKRGVVVAGSIVLVGEAMAYAADRGWNA